jgi:hypothetical protein
MIAKLISCCIALMLCNISFAKIWRVNNNPGIAADFTTAQLAHDAVAVVDGDTVHIEPSITNYGSLSASKRLVWLSTGAFLSSHPGEQASLTPGTLSSVVAYIGSENSVFSVNSNANFQIYTSNIRLERCFVNGPLYFQSGGNNCVIINSYFKGDLYFSTGLNCVITNNIFEGQIYGSAGSSGIITNNVFNAVSPATSTINNSTLQNNIFNKAATYTFVNCTVEYNMASTNTLPPGNNNQNSVNMANVFINDNGTTDGDFLLKAGSPAITAGTPTGTDMGAYGGTSPFKLAVQPAIPSIYKISAPAAPAGNTMSVIISTKSNN